MKKMTILLVILTISFGLDKNLLRVEEIIPIDHNNEVAISKNSEEFPIFENLSKNYLIPQSGFLIGRQEVVGSTIYDWQYCGPTLTRCKVDTVANGINVCWMYSENQNYTDRNIRYNFYNNLTKTWLAPETGINVFSQRSGFGNLDIDPFTGTVYISAHQSIGGVLVPIIARNNVAGSGSFQYCQGPSIGFGYYEPVIAITNNLSVHSVMDEFYSHIGAFYARVQPWCSWSTPILISSPIYGIPGHSYNINASKLSNKVIITWVQWHHQGGVETPVDSGFYILSNDGGITWEPINIIPFPPAFCDIGATPSFHITGFFCMFDNNDNLHIVTQVHPVFYDTLALILPAEIWHYNASNSPAWNRIFRWTAETIATRVEYNSIFACRPSIIQNPVNNYLYVSWEAFDSLNYEPSTNILRADIWIAESPDNGLTWRNHTRITIPNTTTKRYPCLSGVINDTIIITYMIDSIAGSTVQVQGRATRNPIVCHRIPVSQLGFTEQTSVPNRYALKLNPAVPNPFKTLTTIRYSLPKQENVSLQIYDISGRLIKTLVSETKPAGEYSVQWDGRDSKGTKVNSGIYFSILKVADKILTSKVIKTD